MRHLLGLVALVLVFSVLALFIGFGEVVAVAEGQAVRLGHRYFSIPSEVLLTLREQVAGVTALFRALPSPLSDALQAVADALGDLCEVLAPTRWHGESEAPPEGALLV